MGSASDQLLRVDTLRVVVRVLLYHAAAVNRAYVDCDNKHVLLLYVDTTNRRATQKNNKRHRALTVLLLSIVLYTIAGGLQPGKESCLLKGVKVCLGPGCVGIVGGQHVVLGSVVPELSVVLAASVYAGHAAHRSSRHDKRRSARSESDHTHSDGELHDLLMSVWED